MILYRCVKEYPRTLKFRIDIVFIKKEDTEYRQKQRRHSLTINKCSKGFILLQDKIFVIYSVDFLPRKNSNALGNLPALQANKYGDASTLDQQCCCLEAPTICAGTDGLTASTGNNSRCAPCGSHEYIKGCSHCRSASSFRAWGRVSLGMRVASFSASKLMRMVQPDEA